MSDPIRREDAINAIRSTVAQYVPFLNGINMTLPIECEIALRSAPSADRPQGHWTKTDVVTYRCSECGKKQIADDINELNFCCCCGSRNKIRRMKGAEDE